MDAVESSRLRKRKAPKDCPFKVIREVTNPKKQKYSLHILKPDFKNRTVGITYPSVYLKEERADNHYAIHIMHNLNHPNILSLKSVTPSQTETSDSLTVVTFVEPYDGLLWLKFKTPKDCADKLNHIPKPELRGFLRGIVIGLDYLWMRDLYHGNLSWDSTLYYQTTTKLAGFKELKISKDDARWKDVLCFIRMLELLAERACAANQTLYQEDEYFYGELSSLINFLKTLKLTPFQRWKELILDNTFFWNFAEKVKFFANDVSLLLSNELFMQRVSQSPPCAIGWDQNCTDSFKHLLKVMNDYRDNLKRKRRGATSGKPYNGKSIGDYVRCLCGAFTHWKQLKLDVEYIVRGNHPTIFSDFKRLVDTSVDMVQNKVPIQSDMHKVNAMGKSSMLTLAGPKKGKEQKKQQWVAKATNKVPNQSTLFSNPVEDDTSEPTAAGKTSNLTSTGAEEGKEQKKQFISKASTKVPVQIGSTFILVEHNMSEPTAACKTSAGAELGKEREKQCTTKISGSKSSNKTDSSSACGG